MLRFLNTLQTRAAAASILSTDNGAPNKMPLVSNLLPSCDESADVTALDEIDRMVRDLMRDGLVQTETQLDEHHIQMEVARLQAELSREQAKSAQLLEIVRAMYEFAYCTICARSSLILTQLECGHLFCGRCIRRWMLSGDTCPTCRYPIEELPRNLGVYGLWNVLLALRMNEARFREEL